MLNFKVLWWFSLIHAGVSFVVSLCQSKPSKLIIKLPEFSSSLLLNNIELFYIKVSWIIYCRQLFYTKVSWIIVDNYCILKYPELL